MPIEFEWLENGGSQNQDILVLWYGDSYIEAKWIFIILFMAFCVVLFIYVKIRDARNVDDTEDIDDEEDDEDDPELPTVFESGNTVTITKQDSHTYHTTLEEFREANPEFAKEIEEMMEKSNGKVVIRRKVKTTKFGFSTKKSDVIKDSGDDWLSKQRELEEK